MPNVHEYFFFRREKWSEGQKEKGRTKEMNKDVDAPLGHDNWNVTPYI
jgi:hypothetical protein